MSKTRHNYEYEVDLDGNSAPAKVIAMVGQRKRVLEVGAGPGSITKHLYKAGQSTLTAVEIDPKAIEQLSEHCDAVFQSDLNDPAWADALMQAQLYDTVVAADVLEHLYDPLQTLTTLRSLLAEDGYVVISLPHVGHNAIIACLLDEDFAYQDWGLLDRTHIRFFGLKNIQTLFSDAGLKIIDAQFVITAPEKSEFYEKWRKLPDTTKHELEKNAYGNVYQVVLKGVSKDNPTKELDLMSIPTQETTRESNGAAGLKSNFFLMVKQYVPLPIKRKLKAIYTALTIKD